MLFLCGDAASADEFTPKPQDIPLQKSLRSYWDGDIADAISRLEKIGSDGGSIDERTNARLFLAQICSEIQSFVCLDKNNAELLKLQKTITDPNKATAVLRQVGPSIVREFVWEPKFGGANIPNMLNDMNHSPFDTIQPDKYLLLQSSAFEYFLENHDYVEARRAISKMIARAVALAPGDYSFPYYVTEIIQDFYIIGDGPRAYLLLRRLDNFIRSSLPQNNPTHTRYLQTTAGLEASFGNQTALLDALSRLDAAESQLHHLRVSDEWTDDELTQIATQRAAYLFLAGNTAKAVESLTASHLQNRKNEIEASGQFRSSIELEFALVDLFLDRVVGRPTDKNWKALLSKQLPWERGNKSDQYFEMEREFGLALASEGKRPDDQMLEKAAFDAVRFVEDCLFAKTHTFPLPDFVPRIVIGTELARLRQKSLLSDPERDFVVRAIDILQRSVLHSRGDELYLMSGLNSEKERRLAHSWLMLSDRRNELEIDGLVSNAQATWVKRGEAGGHALPKSEPIDSLRQRRVFLVDLDKQVAQLSHAFGEPDSDGATPAGLPGSVAVEALLSNNEVVISEAAFAGNAYKVCIGPHHEFFFTSSPTEPGLTSDLKILRASLTANYAPSEELDRQYPAEAALRTRNFILGGLDRCFGHAQRIIYNPIVDLADIPLSALLDEIPPRMGDGYDLSHAAWLLNKYQFSNVSSVEEFVAARRLAKVAGGEYPFLGIGDPQLSQPLIGAKTGGELLASRGEQLRMVRLPLYRSFRRPRMNCAQSLQPFRDRFCC